jgi:hypothetical protein
MGYRNKIGILDKSVHDEIKRMTYKKLIQKYNPQEDYVACYNITKEIYEIGKYWEHDFINEYTFPLFTRKDTNQKFNQDGEFYGITKEGFKKIIESYREIIIKYYTKMRDEKFDFMDTMHGDPIKRYFKDKVNEWEFGTFSFEGEELVHSWKYEYAIFELVRLYKAVEWDKQIVTITGW